MLENKKILKIYLIISVSLLIVIVLLGLSIFFLTKSQIQTTYNPIDKALQQLGASNICRYNSDGDAFTGAKPYHFEYYLIPDSSELPTEIKQKIIDIGFNDFKTNQETVSLIKEEIAQKNEFDGSDDLTKNSPGYTYNPTNSYLISANSEYNLRIIIHRNETVSLNCIEGADYGQLMEASGTNAIVEVQFTLPE